MFSNDPIIPIEELVERALDLDLDPTMSHANRWLNDHGRPNYEKLEALTEEDTPIAMEELQEFADTFNIDYDGATTPRELLDRIGQAIDMVDDDESMER